MKQQHNRPLLLELGTNWVLENWKISKLPFLASMLVGFLAYTFAFTNKLVNHDEVFTLFFKGGTVSLGRWGLGGLDTIFPNISMPWIYGIFTIVFIAVAACVILRIFSIRNPVLQVLLSGSIMVFPSLIGTFGYMFTVAPYALSFLSAVAAVRLLTLQKNRYCILAAFVCMVFSLSIYQAYISVAASLLLLLVIQQLLQGEEVPSAVKNGIFYVVFLVVSLGAYYGATQIINILKDVSFNDYANGNISFQLSSIPTDIADAYQSFFRYFLDGHCGLLPTPLSRNVHGILLGITMALLFLVLCYPRRKEALRLLLIAGLLVLLPLAINCMHLFTTPDAVHTLVLYGFISVYVLIAIVADACLSLFSQVSWQNFLRQAMLDVVTLGLAVIVFSNIYTANAAYLNLHLRYENAYSFYTSLANDLKNTPEFTEDTKIAILGTYQDPIFYEENFPFLLHLTGVKGFLPDSYSRARFLEFYLGLSIPEASEAEMKAIQESPEYIQMPCYPYYGSTALFGDVLVVKLSE